MCLKEQDNQYAADIKRLAELVSRYTGIPKTRAAAYLEENGASRLFECSYSLVKTDEQFQKLASLFEFMRLFDNLYNSEKNHVINSSQSARDYFVSFYMDKQDREYFSAAFLDLNCNLIKSKVISVGDHDEAPIYPRDILREALFANANSVVISHNHPGRTAKLSSADLEATKEIALRLNAADISLDDHIVVVGGSKAISFAESGIDMGYKNHPYKVCEKNDAQRYHETVKKSDAYYNKNAEDMEDEEMEY